MTADAAAFNAVREGTAATPRARRREVRKAEVFDLGHVRDVESRRRAGLGLMAAAADSALTAVVTLVFAPGQFALALVAAAIAVVAVAISGGYNFRERMTTDFLADIVRLSLAVVVTTWLTLLVSEATGFAFSPIVSIAFAAALIVGLLVIRAFLRKMRPADTERVLIIGSGAGARRVSDLSGRHPERRFQVIGCLDDDPRDRDGDDPPVLGPVAHLPAVLARGMVDRVIVADTEAPETKLLPILRRCDTFHVPVDVLPRFYELIGHKPRTYRIAGTPLVSIKSHRPSRAQRVLKRVLDVTVAGAMLLVSAIPCLIIAAAIKLSDRGPVLFRQRRIGQHEEPFDVLKFRTMVVDADRIGDERIAGLKDGTMSVSDAVTALKPADDPRITRLGRVLRATSLDELPQLLNVLRGDMSLVGPRPLRDFEVDSLTDWERERQRVQPGLTGLWQVGGRSAVEWDERMGMDYLYVRHWTLDGDVRLLCETVPVLLGRRGAQ